MYNQKINQILTDFNKSNPNLSNDDAYEFIEGFIDYLDELIKSNSGKNLGEISSLIKFP